MYIFNVTDPLTLILMLAFAILMIFLGKELKKSAITAIPLFVFLCLLVMHVVQLMSLGAEFSEYMGVLSRCVAADFVFVLLGFISYLWIDDIEAKVTKKKSIDNSLDWFWRKV